MVPFCPVCARRINIDNQKFTLILALKMACLRAPTVPFCEIHILLKLFSFHGATNTHNHTPTPNKATQDISHPLDHCVRVRLPNPFQNPNIQSSCSLMPKIINAIAKGIKIPILFLSLFVGLFPCVRSLNFLIFTPVCSCI